MSLKSLLRKLRRRHERRRALRPHARKMKHWTPKEEPR